MPTRKAQSLISDYEFHNRLIHKLVEGITHAESLIQPPYEGNCLNWVFGHIVTNRSHVLETAGVDHVWKDGVRELYHTGTQPIRPGNNAIQFETLFQYLDESVDLLKPALESMSEKQLAEMHTNYRGEKNRYDHIAGFHWHETYHLGQLEILRTIVHSQR